MEKSSIIDEQSASRVEDDKRQRLKQRDRAVLRQYSINFGCFFNHCSLLGVY